MCAANASVGSVSVCWGGVCGECKCVLLVLVWGV